MERSYKVDPQVSAGDIVAQVIRLTEANADAAKELLKTEDCGGSYDPDTTWSEFQRKLGKEYMALFWESALTPMKENADEARREHLTESRLVADLDPVISSALDTAAKRIGDTIPNLLEAYACSLEAKMRMKDLFGPELDPPPWTTTVRTDGTILIIWPE